MTRGRIHLWTHHGAGEIEDLEIAAGEVVVVYRGRPGNEGRCQDAVLVLDFEDGACILAVADGMGGAPRGDDAAASIVSGLAESSDELDHPTAARAQIFDAIEKVSAEIRAWGVGAATTVMVAAIENETLRTYHVGDSEALLVGQRGKIKHRTISQSPVGYALAAGVLDERAAMVHEQRHLVDSMVGVEGMRIDVSDHRRLAPRDTLVLGSDGLFDNLRIEEIVEIVRKGPLTEAAVKLLDACSERMKHPSEEGIGKPDDLTFLLFRRASKRNRV